MKIEWEKMVSGEPYDPLVPELAAARALARRRLQALNGPGGADPAQRAVIVAELLGAMGDGTWIEPPFHCDYGCNIVLGRSVFFNFNCVVLDVAPVRIGDFVMVGPAVQIYTATHPLSARERRAGLEAAKPVEIGSDVWIGGGAIILPGVRVGAGSVIGAGSVVTRNVPPGVLAAGNPCRVIRTLGEARE